MNFIAQHIEKINQLCQTHHVKKLYAFGSVLTQRFHSKSDIDLLVELEPMTPLEKGETLLSLWEELEQLLGRKIDLLTDQPIKNQVLKQNIEKTKCMIYERTSKEMAY